VEEATVSSSREIVLARVRRATAGTGVTAPVARAYRLVGELEERARVELLCERIRDYRAAVHVVSAATLPGAIAASFAGRSATRVVIPAGIPTSWRPAGLELVEDEHLSPIELDQFDGVLTGCTLAIAETGTIVVGGGPTEGRRALTLVPDLHVCVVGQSQIVELVPEAMRALAEVAARPLTFISGPSATSDIELDRVEGVHGPRTLIVLVVAEHV
jgi:L-lactate utilization protein LutC